jgi:DNA-binding response OmpR family regulator
MEPTDGLTLTQRIRKDPGSTNKQTPIILMTGFSHKMRVESARDAGVTEFITKPFTAKDLYKRIEEVIERPRQFVDSGSFLGPDRRRRSDKNYQGPARRADDQPDIALSDSQDEILIELRDSTRDTT